MDVHSFGYALPDTLESELKSYQDHPSQKSKLSRRPVEFECTADITDEFHGEDMEDHIRDMVLQERLQAQEMSYQAAVSSTQAARWDLDRIFFLAADDSSDDSEGGTEDVESEWREETSQIYQTCRKVESSVHQMKYFYSFDDEHLHERDNNNKDEEEKQRKMKIKQDMKMEQEKAATEFVEMIRSLHGYKCAPLFSAYSNELRLEQAMSNNDLLEQEQDNNTDEEEEEEDDEENDERKTNNNHEDDEDNPYLFKMKKNSQKQKSNSRRHQKRRVADKRIPQTQISFSLSSNGKRITNKALETLESNHITPSERAMIWDTLRKVYQFAEPVHTKRWLSATSRLYEDPSFIDYQSVSTVSHIFFAAVRHLKEALQPRLHEKLKRWANRCLYLIQRRALTLNEFGVTQPTYKAVNVSCAGRSRDTPMETRRLPNILTLISDLHDHKIKEEKREKKQQEKEEEMEQLKQEYIQKFLLAVVSASSSNRIQQIRNQQPERQEQLLREAEESWELHEKPLVEEELMMKYDEDLFEDDSDDSYDEDEDDDDGFYDNNEMQVMNQASLDQLNNNNNQIQTNNSNNTNNSSSNNTTSNNNNRDEAAFSTSNNSNRESLGRATESESIFAGSYIRSRRDSSRTNTTTTNANYQTNNNASSNVFSNGERLFFDFNERKRIQQEQETAQKQMDPRKKRKEMKARRRAQMFAELKRTAMEERAQQELKEELMSFRETMVSS